MDTGVETTFNNYPAEYREPLLQIRELIYSVANKLPDVGELEESLKWGQPTYSTLKPKSGTPIRLDRFGDDKIAMFFHCQTNLVERCGNSSRRSWSSPTTAQSSSIPGRNCHSTPLLCVLNWH